jgi:hypothetical protein
MPLSDEFKGLPMEDLIGAPLIAAANAQGKLAAMTADFIKHVGVKTNGSVSTVEFKYKTKSAEGTQVENVIDVPLLSIVNIPALSVKKAEVAFTMEVKQQTIEKSTTEASSTVEANYKAVWSPFSAKITGSVATKSDNTRSTDKTAKYDIRVEARDDGIPEGLAKVLDMLSANIANPSHAPNGLAGGSNVPPPANGPSQPTGAPAAP